MTALVFPDGHLETLRRELLTAAPNEAGAVLLAGRVGTAETTRLLVRETHLVPPEAYAIQEPLRLSIQPTFLAPLLKRARSEGWSLMLVHTHPFADQASFSAVDDDGERVLMPCLFSRAGDRPHGSLVLGRAGSFARFWMASSDEPTPAEAVIDAGRDLRVHWCRQTESRKPPVEYDRSVRAFGAEGQAAIAALTVGIVGLGGVGSLVAEQLAHLGVATFILLDPDVIEQTNLNRVVGTSQADVARPKVAVADNLIRRIHPNTEVQAFQGDVTVVRDARALLQAHIVFCCTDSHGSRAVLNQLAYQFMIPVIDLGVRIQAVSKKIESITGRVQMLSPGIPCLVCQNLLDPEEVRRDLLTDEERKRDPYIVGGLEPQPAVISLNGTVASLGVTMMLSAVAGFPAAARHQVVRFDRGVVRAVESRADPRCVVCSLRGALGRGDLWPMPGRPD